MKMSESDRIRLQHMLDAAREAMSFAAGRTRKHLDTDRMLVLSLVKDLEIIGEAASKVSDECRSQVAQLDWQDIVDMRHRLVRAYFDIDLDIVWQTVQTNLPFLVQVVGKAMPPGEKPAGGAGRETQPGTLRNSTRQ